MIPNAGRKVMLWASVFLTGYFGYVLFDRLYGAWLTWQGLPPFAGIGFWDVEFGLAALAASEVLVLAAAVAMLAWNVRNRARAATEATYLFWTGLGVMAYFGSQLVLGVVSLGPNAALGGFGFEAWLQPAVPFVLGLLMVAFGVGKRVTERRRGPVSVAG